MCKPRESYGHTAEDTVYTRRPPPAIDCPLPRTVHCVCKDRFVLHNGTPRRLAAPRGASRRLAAPRGASRRLAAPAAPRGASRRLAAPRGASRRLAAPHGASRRLAAPRGVSRRVKASAGVVNNGASRDSLFLTQRCAYAHGCASYALTKSRARRRYASASAL